MVWLGCMVYMLVSINSVRVLMFSFVRIDSIVSVLLVCFCLMILFINRVLFSRDVSSIRVSSIRLDIEWMVFFFMGIVFGRVGI